MSKDSSTSTLVLASSSPRRQALLEQAGIDFQVAPPQVREPVPTGVVDHPRELAEALGYFKARAVADAAKDRSAPVLAADTIVILDGRVLGKAADPSEARQMLHELSRSPHQVVTGVCLIQGDRRLMASDVTTVHMRPMTDDEIDAYVESGEWIGKAGAYAIQETADRYVVRIEGSFTNVVGLPIELVRRMLTRMACDA